MDIVIFFNGLGNQMSQYAFYLQKKQISLSTRFLFEKKSAIVHNGFELEKVFGISYQDTRYNRFLYFIYRIAAYKKHKAITGPILKLLRFFGIEVIDENREYDFNPAFLKPSKGLRFYVGGWHAEKYFLDIKDKLLQDFQFRAKDLDLPNQNMLELIGSVNSVSVHIRRGDFLDSQNYHVFGSVCTPAYYRMAIERIRKIVGKPQFFFFTNDVAWVRENFKADDFSIVDINSGEWSWRDMFLISKCRHHINSNSSFSWWSAWLDQRPDKIVMVPERFVVYRDFKDIYPENWIRLSGY